MLMMDRNKLMRIRPKSAPVTIIKIMHFLKSLHDIKTYTLLSVREQFYEKSSWGPDLRQDFRELSIARSHSSSESPICAPLESSRPSNDCPKLIINEHSAGDNRLMEHANPAALGWAFF